MFAALGRTSVWRPTREKNARLIAKAFGPREEGPLVGEAAASSVYDHPDRGKRTLIRALALSDRQRLVTLGKRETAR